MMSSFYCILLSLCFYDIFVFADEIVCRFDENVEVQLSNNNTLLLQNSIAKFEYDNHIEKYTNRTTSYVRNAFFTALIKQEPNQPYTRTLAKFSNIKELRAASDVEYYELIDERQYCSVTFVQEPSKRVAMHKEVEAEMRKMMLSAFQSELCETRNPIDAKGVVQNMKYRADSAIAQQKLQDTVNVIADFILSKIVYSLTNKYAKIPKLNGSLFYPVLGYSVNYTVFEGFFYNTPHIDRLMNTHLIENNKNGVEVDVAYRLRDINMNFLFQLSDRSYLGRIDVNISKIVFSAKMTFDYTICQAKLDIFRILNMGDLENQITHEISEGLVWYERMSTYKVHKVVYKLITENLYQVIKKMVSLKMDSFRCGTQKKDTIDATTEMATTFGNIIGQIVRKYTNNL